MIHWKEEKKQEVVPRHCQPFAHSKDSEKFIPCPVCREPVFYDIDTLSKSMKPIETPVKMWHLYLFMIVNFSVFSKKKEIYCAELIASYCLMLVRKNYLKSWLVVQNLRIAQE